MRLAEEMATGHHSHCDFSRDTFCQADVDLIRMARIELLEELIARCKANLATIGVSHLKELLEEARIK